MTVNLDYAEQNNTSYHLNSKNDEADIDNETFWINRWEEDTKIGEELYRKLSQRQYSKQDVKTRFQNYLTRQGISSKTQKKEFLPFIEKLAIETGNWIDWIREMVKVSENMINSKYISSLERYSRRIKAFLKFLEKEALDGEKFAQSILLMSDERQRRTIAKLPTFKATLRYLEQMDEHGRLVMELLFHYPIHPIDLKKATRNDFCQNTRTLLGVKLSATHAQAIAERLAQADAHETHTAGLAKVLSTWTWSSWGKRLRMDSARYFGVPISEGLTLRKLKWIKAAHIYQVTRSFEKTKCYLKRKKLPNGFRALLRAMNLIGAGIGEYSTIPKVKLGLWRRAKASKLDKPDEWFKQRQKT